MWTCFPVKKQLQLRKQPTQGASGSRLFALFRVGERTQKVMGQPEQRAVSRVWKPPRALGACGTCRSPTHPCLYTIDR